jgi:hypothetical protein
MDGISSRVSQVPLELAEKQVGRCGSSHWLARNNKDSFA